MYMDLTQLRTFVAVAEEQHLTHAAERLHISQSAASMHVRAIEERLDTQLFIRRGRSLELTRSGQLLLPKAKTLLNEAAQFTSFAREIRGRVEGTIVVGASSEPTASHMGEVVAALRSKHPMITVDLRARPSSGTRDAVKTGEFDIGILMGLPIDPGSIYYQLASMQFRVAGPIAWKEEIEQAGWEQLANLPWIVPTDSSLAHSAMLQELFGRRGLALNAVAYFDNRALARSLLMAGVGMMLMREEHALRGEAERSIAISPLAKAEFPLFMEHLGGRSGDPLIRAFVEAVAAVWPKTRLVDPFLNS